MFDISFLIPGFADQRDGQIHISNARSHFFAHPVHACNPVSVHLFEE